MNAPAPADGFPHRAGQRGAPWAQAGALLLCGLLAACGLKTPPAPEAAAGPPMLQGMRAWLREGQAMVAWWVPSPNTIAHQGGLEGYTVLIERMPFSCPACPPEERRSVALAPEDGRWEREGVHAYYRFDVPQRPAVWRVRVVARYGAGPSIPTEAASLEPPVEIPVHTLAWEHVEPAGESPPAAPAQVRLYWPQRQERIVRVLGADGVMVETPRYFRANLYQRAEGQPWPLTPLNPEPVTGRQLIVSAPGSDAAEEPTPRQFTLRLVDQFGNEGPPAPPVSVDFFAHEP